METKALVRLEPLTPIAIWDLPKARRAEKEAIELARKQALDGILKHDLFLFFCGFVPGTIFAAFSLTLLGTLAIGFFVGAALMAFSRAGIICRCHEQKMAACPTPSPKLLRQAAMEQDLVDAAFRLNDEVFAWNTGAMSVAEADVGERFRNVQLVQRERIAARLGTFETMLSRYRLTLDVKPKALTEGAPT